MRFCAEGGEAFLSDHAKGGEPGFYYGAAGLNEKNERVHLGAEWGASLKPVNFDAIPKFEDRTDFSGSFNAAMLDILLLVLFLVAFFGLAYLSFLRVDV